MKNKQKILKVAYIYKSTALPSSPSHSLTLLKQIFVLKVNHAQFKQTPKCGRQKGNLGPLDIQHSTLPLEPF